LYWYDWMTLATMAAVTITQTARGSKAGMGLPMFEAACVAVAAVATIAHSHTLADMIHARPGETLLGLFLVLAVLAFFVARWLSALVGLSFQSFDGFFSLLFGLVLAWTVAHMVLRAMMMSQGDSGDIAGTLANSSVAREVFSFRTLKALMRLLFNAKSGPDFDPGVE
jgi:hypothetical protein